MLNHNTNDSFDPDRYEDYEDLFDPTANNRRIRRQSKRSARPTPKPASHDTLNDLAEAVDLETDFDISYQPSRYEAEWLVDALRPFYEQTLIAACWRWCAAARKPPSTAARRTPP